MYPDNEASWLLCTPAWTDTMCASTGHVQQTSWEDDYCQGSLPVDKTLPTVAQAAVLPIHLHMRHTLMHVQRDC